MTFSAMVARESDGQITLAPEQVGEDFLPAGEVTIQVEYSSVNYKDALAITPRGGVVRAYPIVPGIDIAGTVVSGGGGFEAGDKVVAHGYDIGTGKHGGYAELARVSADQVVKLTSLTTREAALIGTAGFTAAMSVAAVADHGVRPGDGPIVVTGATGGVGSVSVDLLAVLGYEVVASTGKADAGDYLRGLGATSVIGRLPADPDAKPRPLGKAQWAAGVDCVGGKTLADVLSTVNYSGIVAASGLTGGAGLSTTVLPFILRNVTLRGIDSVLMPIEQRRALWARIESDLRPRHLEEIAVDVPVRDIADVLATVHAGRFKGRAVVAVTGGF